MSDDHGLLSGGRAGPGADPAGSAMPNRTPQEMLDRTIEAGAISREDAYDLMGRIVAFSKAVEFRGLGTVEAARIVFEFALMGHGAAQVEIGRIGPVDGPVLADEWVKAAREDYEGEIS